jgi:hypothetical protein
MLDLQVPLLAAKALLLLLLFAFVYSVVRRGIGDLNSVREDEPVAADGPRGNARGNARADEAPYEAPYEANGGGYGGAPAGVGRRNGYAELVVEDSEVLAPNTRFRIVGGTTSIGRTNESDIILKNDDYVSGDHARLTRHGGLLYVEDAESTNGTFVNGRRAVGATPLRGGDRVRVGTTTFRFAE